MNETRSLDQRLEKVLGLLGRFVEGDFSRRELHEENGDEVAEIIRRLNLLGEQISQSGKVIRDYERRVTAIMDVLLKYTLFDFSEKAVISGNGDEIDAIALGLNTLGEELNDRIEAEKRHTARLEELAVVMETTADGVLLLDPSGVIKQWNKSCERIYGYARNEVVGMNAETLLTEREHLEEFRGLLARVAQGENVIGFETNRRHRGGSEILVSMTLIPIYRNGDLQSISVVLRDVTRQKKAEQKLKQSEERFRSLVEGVRDYAIMMLDPAGNITSWNAGAAALHGYSWQEIINRNYAVFFTHTELKNHVPEYLLKEAIRVGKAVRDLHLVRSDGTSFWANMLLTCLTDSHQHISGFSLIVRDLTETRSKDEEILHYTQTLEQKNEELRKKNAELSSFSYVASHDLQEPLRKIRTFCSRLLQVEQNLTDKGKYYCDRMESAAYRMQALIRSVIDYTALSASDENCEPCEIGQIVNEVLEEMQEELRTAGARVEVDGLCKALVIPRQFRQLLHQLIGNSLKFSSDNRPPHIAIVGRETGVFTPPGLSAREAGYCRISVKDNGIGFEPQFNSQIFEVFQRLHGHDRYPGTGIGLAICRKIVENHGGTIEAHGDPGKGTTITIFLPVPSEKSPA